MYITSEELLKMKDEDLINLVQETSEEEKIEFINKNTDNKLDRIINALELFEKNKNNFKLDMYGYVKKNSFNAWIRKNNLYGIFSECDSYKYGLCGCYRYVSVRQDYFNKKMGYDKFNNFISEVFFRLLKNLRKKAIDERNLVDEHYIMSTKLKSKLFTNQNTYIQNLIMRDCDSEGYLVDIVSFDDEGRRIILEKNKKLTIEQTSHILEMYEEMEKMIEQKKKQIDLYILSLVDLDN